MSFVDSFDSISADEATNATPDILDRNWQTTTALGLSVATGGVTGALMLSAFPAQTLIAGGTIGGLAVAGQRRANGKDPMFGLLARFEKKPVEKTDSDIKATEAVAD